MASVERRIMLLNKASATLPPPPPSLPSPAANVASNQKQTILNSINRLLLAQQFSRNCKNINIVICTIIFRMKFMSILADA